MCNTFLPVLCWVCELAKESFFFLFVNECLSCTERRSIQICLSGFALKQYKFAALLELMDPIALVIFLLKNSLADTVFLPVCLSLYCHGQIRDV